MEDNSKTTKANSSRRIFIKKSGMALVGTSLVYPSGVFSASSLSQDSILKV